MITIKPDDGEGIIRTVGSGRWSLDDVDTHFKKLSVRIAALRESGRPIRLLSDVTNAEIQWPVIEARIIDVSTRLYRSGDRTALVVKNNLLKGYVRPLILKRETALFCSLAAAETWLSAHDVALSA
ncbi:hypothetical protein ACT009_15005 [Sphingomonas sp. Tas61C01]|uniref:hypothetical protein n=1 Tax=Sphingomonas sp. Tas61C01 TaxID=3458297 RepID=UPI00403EB615